MKKTAVILLCLVTNFSFAMEVEKERPYQSKAKFIHDYNSKKGKIIDSYMVTIEQEINNHEYLSSHFSAYSLGLTSYKFHQFEKDMEKCDENFWQNSNGKRLDCNELIKIYSDNFNVDFNK